MSENSIIRNLREAEGAKDVAELHGIVVGEISSRYKRKSKGALTAYDCVVLIKEIDWMQVAGENRVSVDILLHAVNDELKDQIQDVRAYLNHLEKSVKK